MVYRVYFRCIDGYYAYREYDDLILLNFAVSQMKSDDFIATVEKVEIDLFKNKSELGDFPLCTVDKHGNFKEVVL